MKNFVVTQLHTEMCRPRPARMLLHHGTIEVVSLVDIINRRNPGRYGSARRPGADGYQNTLFLIDVT
ncbi:hypothetical protein [Parabacteroides johnsonii]|uniref:hypothetical protein n=1 Tax=Parabacteroides johnsonii TaxID=387661 RepID=UPI0024316C48|nr:hypothetical protein [Parabacteroides johnsonii]